MNYFFNFNLSSKSSNNNPKQLSSEPKYETGVVLANLGSPDDTRLSSIRKFLREFLSDRRVVDLSPWKWLPILHLLVLPFRPLKTRKVYQQVWYENGSPLTVISERQRAKLELKLKIPVEFGMTYGNPSMESALQKLRDKGCMNIVALPLYPQYSQATSGAVFDRIARAMKAHPYVPNLRFINSYSLEASYVSVVTKSIQAFWKDKGEPDHLLISFHGIPVRYETNGDPYRLECEQTFKAISEGLSFPKELMKLCYQSKFGRDKWLEPKTIDSVEALANGESTKSKSQNSSYIVDVVCPGFSTDCIETLEEIAIQCSGTFSSIRGPRAGQLRLIPCLNDADAHIDMMASVIKKNGIGWI